MSPSKTIFKGHIVSPQSLDKLNIFDGFVTVENGKITKFGTKSEYQSTYKSIPKDFQIVQMTSSELLLPGFIDCHTHAPQFPNIGLGLDRPLLEWLDKYTFPLEKQYSNMEFAFNIYQQVVKRFLKNGTTTACYFGSLSPIGTMQLVRSVLQYKQRAFVGKVSMNIENDAGYFNDTKTEIAEVESFVNEVFNIKSDLVEPIVTPRFAVSCDEELMTGLSSIAKKYDCRIQSHISENTGEIELVLKTFQGAKSYTDIYDRNKILNNKCIMAHAVHLSDEEMEILSERGVSIAHCPASNTRLMSGLCPLRKILNHNIVVGLGTDVSGGDSASILDAMRRAMDVSSHLQLQGAKNAAVNWKEVLYLATLGGAKALNLDHKIGNFETGKDFDALLVNVFADGGAIEDYKYSIASNELEVAESLLQRFIYLGDDRNIKRVFVNGVEVKST